MSSNTEIWSAQPDLSCPPRNAVSTKSPFSTLAYPCSLIMSRGNVDFTLPAARSATFLFLLAPMIDLNDLGFLETGLDILYVCPYNIDTSHFSRPLFP